MSGVHDAPTVYRAVLSPREADRILRDLRNTAHDIHLLVRDAPHVHGHPRDLALDDVPELLQAGCAVQIRYRFRDASWSDTLSRQGGAIQLVRCEIPSDLHPQP